MAQDNQNHGTKVPKEEVVQNRRINFQLSLLSAMAFCFHVY